jgi:methanethiol S-methyltransferase
VRAATLALYGALSYTASLASLYVIFGWLGGPVPVPVRLDQDGPPGAMPLAWNTAVMLGFGLYHSVYARSSVKVRMRRVIGRNLERATYNLLSAVLAVALCLLWRPLPAQLWTLPPAAAMSMPTVHGLLWVVHLTSIVLMNHNDFFGLRQIGLAMRGQAYRPLPPISRRYYLATRLTLVMSLALIPWASDVMTVGRLQFCLFMTAYIALGAWLSNRDRGDVTTVPASALAPSPRQSSHAS